MSKSISMILAFSLLLSIYSLSFSAIIIDHTCTDISQIPTEWINAAKNNSEMYYAHTSHGGQLPTGLELLETADPFYSIEHSYDYLPEENNTLNIFERSHYNNWDYTDTFSENISLFPPINYSMYAWCTQLNEFTSPEVQDYLDRMVSLENAYPNVTFIYMTGNAQAYPGSDPYNRYLRNEQIRSWVNSSENRILFDFADLDSWWYNPVTEQWEQATDEYNGQIVPVEHPQFYGEEAGHTTYESCEQKGRAVWWMMARLEGWGGNDTDGDGITNELDNCPEIPNGPDLGTCVLGGVGMTCMNNDDCGSAGFCSMNQEDVDGDGIGDVCALTCEGYCDGAGIGGCWCDASCLNYGDCCPDFDQWCEVLPSCDGICDQQHQSGCWCDNSCANYGDCCQDFDQWCGELPYCEGICGQQHLIGCYCDTACLTYNDCCPDYIQWCGVAPDSCEGRCDGSAPAAGCYCDATCVEYGDCCPDQNEKCASCEANCDQQTHFGCWCDRWCITWGDCCSDACGVCGYCE